MTAACASTRVARSCRATCRRTRPPLRRRPLRAVARDRAVVRVLTTAGETVGRIDAVGADHVDVALVRPDSGRPSGEVRTVAGWFDRLPESLMQNSPMMYVNKVWALALMYHQSRLDEIEEAARSAERALDLSNADQALRRLVAGHIASVQAYLMQSTVLAGEEPSNLIATSQKAQELLPESERGIRSVNALNIGYGYMRLGDLPSAAMAYQQVVDDGVAGGNWYAAIYGQMALIGIKINKGELGEALQLCDANIERFNRFVAGQRFPPIGELYSMQGSLLLEQNRLAEAEQILTQGLSLLNLTQENQAVLRRYSTLSRLRFAQGDWEGMLENTKVLEESWAQVAFYAQALRHRLSTREPYANQSSLDAARSWLKQMGRFEDLPDFASVDPVSEIYFHARLSVAHILTRLAAQNPKDFSLLEVHNQLARHEKLAEAHGLLGWLIEIWIARALMYQVEGKADLLTINSPLKQGLLLVQSSFSSEYIVNAIFAKAWRLSHKGMIWSWGHDTTARVWCK